jgi:hypothetical protein
MRQVVAIPRAIAQQIGNPEFRHDMEGLRDAVASKDLQKSPRALRRGLIVPTCCRIVHCHTFV